jgi:hypothetical protein
MKKIIEYTIFDGGDLKAVISIINDIMKQGYQPFGPLATSWLANKTTLADGFTIYSQAMVRYEE